MQTLRATGSSGFCFGGAIGIAHFPDDADNVKDLLIVADKEMYRDKVRYKEEKKSC